MAKSKAQTEPTEAIDTPIETITEVPKNEGINPEYYNAYKEIFQYIYPKVDINVWNPEIMKKIIIVSNDI